MLSTNTANTIESDIKLNLLYNPKAQSSFPLDSKGQYKINFKNKKYQFQSYVLTCSNHLSGLFENSSTKEEKEIELKYGTSEIAFDYGMKLLFGFKDVVISEQELLQVVVICNELDINEVEFMNNLDEVLLHSLKIIQCVSNL